MQNNYSKGKEVLEAGKDLQFDQVGTYEYTNRFSNGSKYENNLKGDFKMKTAR
jgi:hypothetical protein